jgi:drug/metabolite transporter (DMT)-like permease
MSNESGRADSNRRPSAPKADALPGCATSRMLQSVGVAATDRSRAIGYAMVAVASTLFAINAPVVKVMEGSGLTAQRLTEIRSTGAFLGFVLFALLTRPQALKVTRRQLALLAALGIGGLALVQWAYFFAIHRLPIGEVLLIQYVAPLLVALWARFAFHDHVGRRIWVALAFSLSGLVLIVQLWRGRLDGVGIAVACVGCLSYAFYLLIAERASRRRDPVSLLAWGMLFASVFWALAEPWWSFPTHDLHGSTSLLGHLSSLHAPLWLLVSWMVVLGALVPFLLVVAALPRIGATRTAIVAMLEPVVAILIAWAWLGESLDGPQLVGAALTLGGIVLAQTAR